MVDIYKWLCSAFEMDGGRVHLRKMLQPHLCSGWMALPSDSVITCILAKDVHLE